MATLTSWANSETAVTVQTKAAIMPKFALATTAPDTAALNAVAAKEAADGWPSDVVTRAHNRRNRRDKFWVGPRGLARGDRPSPALLGDGYDWIYEMVRSRQPMSPYKVTRDGSGKQLAGQNNWIHETGADQASKRLRLARALTGVNLQVVDEVTITGTPHTAIVAAQMDTWSKNGEYFVVLIAESTGAAQSVALRCLPIAEGLRGIVYTNGVHLANEGNVSAFGPDLPFPAPYNRFAEWFHPSLLICDEGWKNFLSEQYPLISGWDVSPASGDDMMYTQVAWDGVVGAPRTRISYFTGSTSNTAAVASPWDRLGPSGVTGGLATLGLRSYSAYHIGDPEFANAYHIMGNCTWAGGVVTYDTTEVYVEWRGERIIEVKPDLSEADRAALRGRVIVSRVGAAYPVGPISETELELYALAADAGTNLSEEVLVPAQTTPEKQPAVTFAMAAARASAADRQVFHTVSSNTVSDDAGAYVKVYRNGDSAVFEVWGATGLLSTEDGEVLYALAAGLPVDNTATGDPFIDKFQMTYTEIRSNGYRLSAKDHLTEGLVFRFGLPILERLSRSELVGVSIMQHALNRKQMTSYVLGAITMGQVARRRLI